MWYPLIHSFHTQANDTCHRDRTEAASLHDSIQRFPQFPHTIALTKESFLMEDKVGLELPNSVWDSPLSIMEMTTSHTIMSKNLDESIAAVATPSFYEGGVDVVGVVTPLVRGGAQVVLHGDQVVELSVLLEVHEKEEEGEDGEGQIEVESERGELKERRTCTWMT